MFYQQTPSIEKYFRFRKAKPWKISMHIHSFYELLCGVEGDTHVTIGEHEYIIKPGEAVLIFPYQPHMYTGAGSGYAWLCTFAPDVIPSFSSHFANMRPTQHLFKFQYDIETIASDSDIFSVKAFLYSMSAAVASQLKFKPFSASNTGLLEKIFLLVEENFRNSAFSLSTLADTLTYDYSYISKFFLEKTGVKFSHYLNLRRLTAAAVTLQNETRPKIAQVASECGYNSIRSFNRNFKDIYGTSPLEYAEKGGAPSTTPQPVSYF